MAATKTVYATASLATERALLRRSGIIWNQGSNSFPWAQVAEDNNVGDFLWDNFLCWMGTVIASNLGNYVGSGTAWHSFEASGASLKLSAADNPTGYAGSGVGFGVLKMVTGATAHNSVQMELGGTANAVGTSIGAFGVGSNAAATVPSGTSLPKLFFETRVRFVQSTVQSAFIGLAVPNKTSGVNTVYNGSDVYQNMNCIGFQLDGATDTTKLNAIYGIAASAPVVVGNGGVPSTAAYAGQNVTPVVAGALTDFTKIGFVFDPTNVQALRFYQDGYLLGSQTLPQITAAKWPSNVPLNVLYYLQAEGAGGASVEMDVDWVAIGQLLNLE